MNRIGGLWLAGGSGLWNLTTTPVALNTWDHANDGRGGIDADVVNGKIVCKVPGLYLAFVSLTFTVTAGHIIYAELRENDNAPGGSQFRAHAEGIASGGPVNITLFGSANLNENDIVQVYVYSNQAGGTNFVHVDGQFGLLGI